MTCALTAREVIEKMETLVIVKYSNRYGQVFTEAPPQFNARIMDVFDIKIQAQYTFREFRFEYQP